jgi:hypothetical protein
MEDVRAHSASLLLLCVLAASGSACVHAQARTAAEPPPLDVPLPPPRVIQNADAEVPQPVSVPAAVPAGVPAATEEVNRSAPARPPARPAPARSDAAKPVEPPKADPTAVADVPKPAEQAPSPLQTTSAQREGEVEAAIRAVIARAQNDLNRVNYRALSPDARTQYDGAKGFITQAQDALRARNLVYAKSLADKAGTLATQLAGR